MEKIQITDDVIASFLEGRDPQRYITNIEVPYYHPQASLIINDPVQGKYLQKKTYKPFLWMKEEVAGMLFNGNRAKIKKEAAKSGIKFKGLKTTAETGFEPDRLKDGYKYLATTENSYSTLLNFFKSGGLDVYGETHRHLFMTITPVEQFMIQTGKRLFKGFEEYNDIHKFQFDLETEGLNPKTQAIFQIGMRDNRGFEHIIEITGDTPSEKRENERQAIKNFFKVIDMLKPDVINGYNSENFDWNYFDVRCQVLGMSLSNIAITLDNENNPLKRKDSQIKLGGASERYQQTYMWGYSILDIYHAVRKAQAINSEIKAASLKYITKFSKVAKPNRVYVAGDMLNKIWADKDNYYYLNDDNGDWFKYVDPSTEGLATTLIDTQNEKIESNDYEIVSGGYIIRRYLLDDLWETDMVDDIYNQATFLVSKILPTTFMRAATMGTAGTWKLIMMAWSYENGLALPALEPKRDFTGGLARLNEVGFARRVAKLDYAALYPNIQLTHGIFPDLDTSGVMHGLLFYIVNQRDIYKYKKNFHGEECGRIKTLLKDDPDNEKLKAELKENEYLKSSYDKKQLPLKILANSFFGSFGAPYLFNWGDTNSAEEITCRGRQYLRLMVRHFYKKYDFRPLVGDSVTFNTPIYIKYKDNGTIDIKPICDIFNSNSEVVDDEGLRDFEEKPYEVLTVNGWKDIQYTYRHKTEKQIHRVLTKDRLVCVTEDHSLFQNGIQVKPSTLNRGDSIDVYDLPHHNSGTFPEERADFYWLLGYFLGDGSAIYGPRKIYYKSRKTGEVNINKGVRGEWKISSSNLGNLERLKVILEENWVQWGINPKIKDHRKSSGVYNLVVYKTDFSERFCEDFYTSYREKKVPTFVLNTTLENKKAFMDGVCASDGYGDDMETVSDIGMKSQIAMSGIGYLLNNLGVAYKIRTRKDKENFISFRLRNGNRNNSEFTNKTKMQTDEVWLNETIENRDKDKYVYDISTVDGTFIGGIGGINLKNTDGYNFAIPDTVDDISYLVKGTHRLTEADKGKTLTGLKAVVSDFNEMYMIGRMGLDIDDVCNSTINFSRKNYANDIGGKIKLVGNTIKSKKLPTYIEEFLNTGIRLLLDGNGKDFVELYYAKVDEIFNYEVPLAKIATKAKVNDTLETYKAYCKKTNKAGNLMARKAYMELIITHDLKPDLGDVIYYVNTGTAKSHPDLKTIKDEKGVITDVELNCKLISTEQMEKNPDLTTDEYNVAKYLAAFNKRIKPLMVCFDDEIRNNLIVDTKTDRKTKELVLKERKYFTDKECELISGKPLKEGDQDTYEDLMRMDDKEIRFWTSVDKVPNNIDESEWDEIKSDYSTRMVQVEIDMLQLEKDKVTAVLKRLPYVELNAVHSDGQIPNDLLMLIHPAEIINDDDSSGGVGFYSNRIHKLLFHMDYVLEFTKEAFKRDAFFETIKNKTEDEMFELWENHKNYDEFRTGDKLGREEEDIIQPEVDYNKEERENEDKEMEREHKLTEEDDEWDF